MKPLNLFITCSSHLEEVLKLEIESLGYEDVRIGFRGVYVNVESDRDIYRINYCSRIASRVLLPILSFRCNNRNDLYNATASINWRPYLRHSKTLAIDANVDSKEIRNSLFAAQVVKDAICDQMMDKTGSRPSVDTADPDLQLNLFIRHGKAVLSLDTSGAPLHKRGYRQDAGAAPLRETLAAALLFMAEYSPTDVMIDPCAGSGTFLIEAALMASKTPPGIFRKKWGFFNMPDFSEEVWLKVKIEEDAKREPLVKGRFFGVELNRDIQRMAMANLKAVGLHAYILVAVGDFTDYEPDVLPTFLMTNPPYGKRLEEEGRLVPLYRALGDFMKRKMEKPARGFVLSGSAALSKEVGLAAKRRHAVDNGGIDARLLEFDVY